LIKKFTAWFALAGYFLTLLYYFGPRGLAYGASLFRILPFWMCIVTGHGMPSPAVALFIAPINAMVYGTVGATIGWVFSGLIAKFRRRPKAKTAPSSC